jgi:hypothetical protein
MENGGIKHWKRLTNPAYLKGLRHTPHQSVRDHAQGLQQVLSESLEVLLVLHLILVVERKEGLGVRVGRVPEFKG